jgi:hypothetical protein
MAERLDEAGADWDDVQRFVSALQCPLSGQLTTFVIHRLAVRPQAQWPL